MTISTRPSPSTSAAVKTSRPRFQSPAGPASGLGLAQTRRNAAPSHFSRPVRPSALLLTTISAWPSPSTSAAARPSSPRFQFPAGPVSVLGAADTRTIAAPSHFSTPVEPFRLLATTISTRPSPSTSMARRLSWPRPGSPAWPPSGLEPAQTSRSAAPFHFSRPARPPAWLTMTISAWPSPSTSAAMKSSPPRSQLPAGPCSGLGLIHTGTSAAPFHLRTCTQPAAWSATSTSAVPSPSRSAAMSRASLWPPEVRIGPADHEAAPDATGDGA